MSNRHCAAVLLITTPCSHRPAENDKEKTYEPPDGNTITVGAESFRYAEVLFQPSLAVRDQRHDTSFQCFMKRDVATRKELYTSVV